MNAPLFGNCGHCVPGVDEDCGCSILVARKCAWKSFAGCSSSSKISSDLFPALLDSLTRIRLWRLRWILWNVWKERKTVFFCNCSLHNVKDRLSIFIVHFTRNFNPQRNPIQCFLTKMYFPNSMISDFNKKTSQYFPLFPSLAEKTGWYLP